MKRATGEMRGAEGRVSAQDLASASLMSGKSVTEMEKIISDLERLQRHGIKPAGLANEDAPKEFEALISEYFPRLSYTE